MAVVDRTNLAHRSMQLRASLTPAGEIDYRDEHSLGGRGAGVVGRLAIVFGGVLLVASLVSPARSSSDVGFPPQRTSSWARWRASFLAGPVEQPRAPRPSQSEWRPEPLSGAK